MKFSIFYLFKKKHRAGAKAVIVVLRKHHNVGPQFPTRKSIPRHSGLVTRETGSESGAGEQWLRLRPGAQEIGGMTAVSTVGGG